MSYRGRRTINRPFGWVGPNGLNFSKSVGDRSSVLSKVVSFLRVHGPCTKKDILTKCLGKTVDILVSRKDTYIYSPTYGTTVYTARNLTRGYFSESFAGMVHAGFIRHYRVGNKVMWDVGPNEKTVIHNKSWDEGVAPSYAAELVRSYFRELD